MNSDIIIRLAVALAIGLVVGMERGWREREATAGSRTAGIRTYSLSGLLGGVAASLAQSWTSPLVFAAAFIAFTGAFTWFKREEAKADANFSVTGVVAGLIVFAAGGMAVAGDLYAASAAGVATAGLLASREVLHAWLKRLTWAELRSALLLLAMTVIVLPVLPNRTIDPFGGFNPWQVWLFTILTAAISFTGYVVNKLAGAGRGLALLGLAGGIVSSTVVTVTLAQRSREGDDGTRLAGGAMLAAMVSVLRVTLLAALINPQILAILGPAAGAAAVIFGLWGGLLLRHAAAAARPDAHFQNPFEVRMVLLIGLSIAAASVLFGWLSTVVSTEALYGAAAIGGLIDVDALTLSTVRLVPQNLSALQAGTIIAIGLATNAAPRAVLAAMFGTRAFAIQFVGASLAAAAGGAAAMLLPTA
jgi:uncharacterized membrane protein (DUF4010 family)